MKKMKALLFLLVFIMFPLEANALSVSKNDVTMEKGSNEIIDLYINVEEEVSSLSFNMTFSTYDIPATLSLEPGIASTVSGVSYNLTFATPVVGSVKIGTINIKTVDNPTVTKGTVNITYPKAYNLNGDKILLDYQDININIGSSDTIVEPIEEVQMLEKIESNIVNINLEKDVYDYEVTINESVTELDLNPIIVDTNYKVDITTQKISELSNNTIVIKVSNGERTEEYKIKVNVSKETIKEENKEEVKEEKKETKKTTSFKYKGKWVLLIIALSGVLFLGIIINEKMKK